MPLYFSGPHYGNPPIIEFFLCIDFLRPQNWRYHKVRPYIISLEAPWSTRYFTNSNFLLLVMSARNLIQSRLPATLLSDGTTAPERYLWMLRRPLYAAERNVLHRPESGGDTCGC
jgi:hypothetical protein